MVPINEASITTAKSEIETVVDNIISPESTSNEHPKAKMAAMIALMNATINTF